MKNFVLTFVLTFFTFIGFVSADPWEAMTESEAKELMAFLKKNPYVFDYCDCCDEVARQYDNRKAFGHLIKIEKMEIVPCAWDESRFSVNIVQSKILAIGNIEGGKFVVAQPNEEDIDSYRKPWPITLNYSWTIKSGKASRLYNNINYKEEEVKCGGISEFPKPDKVPAKLKKAYQKFLKRK
jgi:hypothetical protein